MGGCLAPITPRRIRMSCHPRVTDEATTWGARFPVLASRGVSRGWARPVAWTVLAATATHAWRREWWRLRRQGRRAVPRSGTVRVLAERGLYARGLLRRLTRLGWPP